MQPFEFPQYNPFGYVSEEKKYPAPKEGNCLMIHAHSGDKQWFPKPRLHEINIIQNYRSKFPGDPRNTRNLLPVDSFIIFEKLEDEYLFDDVFPIVTLARPLTPPSSNIHQPPMIAMSRLHSLLRKLRANPELRMAYHAQLKEFFDDGFVVEADNEYGGICTYLPHRPVVREHVATTKCRPVFDGYAHGKGQSSVNHTLEVGPNLNPDVLEVLIRFRLKKVAWTADITKAFLQISLTKEDSQALRFLWVDDPARDHPRIIDYCWVRLPFGLTCSPYILRAVIGQNLKSYESSYPNAVAQLSRQLYVDDWIGGSNTVGEAVETIIFKTAHLIFAKWSTNSKELANALPQLFKVDQYAEALPIEIGKTLGVHWNRSSDRFCFAPSDMPPPTENITKRQLASLALTVYDS